MTRPKTPFARIGTRGSPLALAQAGLVRDGLAAAHGVDPADIAVEAITTRGDATQKQNLALAEIGGKGLFTAELERLLLAGAIDIAVHSAKDVATVLPEGLAMTVFLEREDVRDAFISPSAPSLDDLPPGARLGTSSIRRAAQARRHRPDLVIVDPFRGNVGTRLRKLAEGQADATLLAAAGLARLGMAAHVTAYLDPDRFPPAPAQGAIGLEIRAGDARAGALIAPLDHRETAEAVTAERALLARLDGSCRTPIAALTRREGETLILRGQILDPDGTEAFEAVSSGSAADAEALGLAVGERLRADAGAAFFARLDRRDP